MPHGLVRQPQAARDIRSVPRLAVVVRQHGPEPAQCRRGTQTQLWDVALQKRADEARRQAMESASVLARNARGKPPRTQSAFHLLTSTSSMSKPARSTNSTRPANDFRRTPDKARPTRFPRTRKSTLLPRAGGRKALSTRQEQFRTSPGFRQGSPGPIQGAQHQFSGSASGRPRKRTRDRNTWPEDTVGG